MRRGKRWLIPQVGVIAHPVVAGIGAMGQHGGVAGFCTVIELHAVVQDGFRVGVRLVTQTPHCAAITTGGR